MYERIDAPATPQEKAILLALSPDDVSASELAGDPIEALLTAAPGNGAAIGGLKVVTAHGWFAARPSGTEDVYKLYAESFRGIEHLRRIQEEARAIVGRCSSHLRSAAVMRLRCESAAVRGASAPTRARAGAGMTLIYRPQTIRSKGGMPWRQK